MCSRLASVSGRRRPEAEMWQEQLAGCWKSGFLLAFMKKSKKGCISAAILNCPHRNLNPSLNSNPPLSLSPHASSVLFC